MDGSQPEVIVGSGCAGGRGAEGRSLGEQIVDKLAVEPCDVVTRRFPDGEIEIEVGAVRGKDVYIVQSTGPPVNDHLMELLLLVDACRRSGAARVTAVLPYLGYARQDRRSRPGGSVGARVVADAIVEAGVDRMVVVDPHLSGFEAVCSVPVSCLSALAILERRLTAAGMERPEVVIAPDFGAAKLAGRLASMLGASLAVVDKSRLDARRVSANELVGGVAGCRAVIVDDMLVTGGTVESAARLAIERGARSSPTVVVTHGLMVPPCLDRLHEVGIGKIFMTDSVEPLGESGRSPLPVTLCSIAPVLSSAIDRLHRDEPLDEDALLR
jgi:ribose-phosphate pyrophosphokinase